ncbi:MAG: S24/S26 family peptidase, partial [Vulcanimicrobiaceae bacterium]
MPRPELDASLVELVASQTGSARVRIVGRSMRPLLRAGMVVEVEPLAEPPRIGDILVFRGSQRLVAHRLVASNDATYITCGDAFPERAEFVPAPRVAGRVEKVWSREGEGARRVDGRVFRLAGAIFARTRTLRAFLRRARNAGDLWAT